MTKTNTATKSLKTDTLKPALLAKTGKRRSKLKAALDIQAIKAVAKNDLLPDLAISRLPVADLVPATKRVKKTTDRQVSALVKSIAALGFIGGVLVVGQTLIDGHARLEAMRLLGMPLIPTIDVSHLTDSERSALSLSINRIAETGEWDLEVVREVLLEFEVEGFDLELTGFDAIESTR